MNDLITKIQSELPGFSKGQKQIARFILEHYDKAAFMTASRLGVTVGVSESTVVRFATELGYDGYPHLQRALQEMIRNKLTSVQRMEVAGDRMGGRDVLQTVLHADTDMIRVTLDEIDRDAFQGAVDALMGAKRIYILGVRSSSALASFLGFYFNLLFENVTLVHTNSVSEIFEQVLRVGPGDVLFGISFPRYSKCDEVRARPRCPRYRTDRLAAVAAGACGRSCAARTQRYGELCRFARGAFVGHQRTDRGCRHEPPR